MKVDAFPAASSPFLPGYSGPSPLTSDPAYRSPNQMAQLWASHAAAHEGYAPHPGGLYPSPYHLPLGNLEPPPPSLGLAQHHHLYNAPHQERFFLPVSLPQPPLQPSSVPPSSTPQSSSREGGRDRDRLYRVAREREEPQEGGRDRDRLYREEREEPQEGGRDRDRLYREERERDEPQEGGRDRDRLYRVSRERDEPQEGGRDRDRLYREEREREEPQEGGREIPYREERGEREPRPYSVVDLTQDGRSGERERHRERETERDREVFLHHPSASRPPQGSSSSGRYPETDDTPTRSPNPNPSPHTHTDRLRKTESTYSGGLLPGPAYPAHREPIREQHVSAPTYVPSVEVYDEQIGPIQIASQARDKQDKLREREKEREKRERGFLKRHYRTVALLFLVICPIRESGRRAL
ncbi:zinc finger CCCH domain-containing protein 13-like isoform X5 [Oncorhynchus keta]|uniref:zinc finger CCCH domain-containing protein 13-like isoform X2 n=1 Tax=Oncorhynchus keta TaxID=8018 RepID=UPI00227A410F|nr:zinc finger CCCH domain-containing protein 13-like isoform X2 [Oncorhynchus keta]XP_052365422.1 zinc finger CCCH domain-containing protein 13-like isoform X3 [Oncorhynchus keta]XP_052365423.1 zinc finger CCCH domain-containing protein 13-like isoform X4 [Oncorhynchus keta]XP_052365424.1 zinc finger CCCH domain-containing protein 13-like isoform X5 [Oncorhynchus keta]